LPALTLENTYSEGIVSRVTLENSGEKFYLLDKVNGVEKVYNSDHTLWKTIPLPKPVNAIYLDTPFISETLINSDNLLEIAYNYYTVTNNVYTYVGKIINENNAELLTVPESSSIDVSILEGCDNKLMVRLTHSGFSYSTSVYQLPSLALENTYESEVARIKLENSGEKYYTNRNSIDGFAKIYNSNHTLWKSIFLDIPFNPSEVSLFVNIVSETKIASDPLLEIGYSYVYHSPLMYDEWYGQIMNENGLTYLNTSGAQSYFLSELPDAPTKLIELVNFPDEFENTPNYKTNVYTIDPSMAINNFQNITDINIAPNPATSILNINTKKNILEATIYNAYGSEVEHQKAINMHAINVENLTTGIYLLTLLDEDNHKSVHKISISH
jgi:hypothetical protein